MKELMARLDGTVEGWCAENDIDEDVLDLLIGTYCHEERSAAAAIVAFRLGFAAAERQAVRGTPARRYEGPRYAVQFVVVDRLDGTLMAPLAEDPKDADQLAVFLNEVTWPDA